MKRTLILLSLLLSTAAATTLSAFNARKFPKVSAADFATPAEAKDSTVDAVFIYEMGETRFAPQLNRFTVERTIKARVQILTEDGKDYANKSILYLSNKKLASDDHEQVLSVNAAAYNLVNGKVVKTSMPSKYIYKEQVDDDYKQLKFTVPDVKVGSIIEYEFTIRSPHYTDLPSWTMQRRAPVRYSYCYVVIPKWFNYHIEERGSLKMRSERGSTTISVPMERGTGVADAVTYTVEAENVPSFKGEDMVFCKEDYILRVDFELLNINYPGGGYKTYTSSWNDVREFLNDRAEYDKFLKMWNPLEKEQAELPLQGKSAAEKASMLFALLKKKLKWNKEYALGCKNPQKAMKEGKGTNAELNFIFLAMLRDAGIKASPLLVRMRNYGHLPITYASIDKLSTFLVAFADENGYLYFADSSSDYGDINVLPVSLMADGVLYRPNIMPANVTPPTRGEIYDLSELPGSSMTSKINCIITPEGKIAGQRIYTLTGTPAMTYKRAYHEAEDSLAAIEAKEKNLECKVQSFRVKNAEGTGYSVEERIRFVKEAMTDGDKIYLNPLIFQDEKTNYFLKAERVLPVEFPTLMNTTVTTTLQIPEGYELESLPEAKTISLPGYLSASISFTQQAGALMVKYQSLVENTFVPVQKYADLQQFWKSLLDINSLMICLKKK